MSKRSETIDISVILSAEGSGVWQFSSSLKQLLVILDISPSAATWFSLKCYSRRPQVHSRYTISAWSLERLRKVLRKFSSKLFLSLSLPHHIQLIHAHYVDKTRDLVSLPYPIKSHFHALCVLWTQEVVARVLAFSIRSSSADRLSHTKHNQAAKIPYLPLAFWFSVARVGFLLFSPFSLFSPSPDSCHYRTQLALHCCISNILTICSTQERSVTPIMSEIL